MSKDTAVADIRGGKVFAVNERLMPLYLQRTDDFEGWLEGRAIDTHRSNSRLLKKALRLTSSSDAEVVLKVNAATITDAYWFKPENSELTYGGIRFKENMFDKLALYGDPDSFNNAESLTPELTNTGSFEKCWRTIGGKWWLYKQGSDLERFSELFICELGKALGFSMAHYEQDGVYIRSLDFTGGASVNFEPASSLMGENEDYAVNFNAFIKLSEKCAGEYLKIIYLDTLCFNMDRHAKNYGILRNVETGEILGLAPNFDNNIALISNGYPRNISRTNDRLIQLWEEFLQNSREASRRFAELAIPAIDRAAVEACLDKVPVEASREFIREFLLNGQERLERITRSSARI
jgi:hypothetical protein